jgi:hypothetical protein
MYHRLTRQELYDRVWSQPMHKLAPRFGVSGVALAKTCRRANIPVPERGYWARLHGGKIVLKRQLEPRALGMSDRVTIGERPYETHALLVSRLLNEPTPRHRPFRKTWLTLPNVCGRWSAGSQCHRLRDGFTRLSRTCSMRTRAGGKRHRARRTGSYLVRRSSILRSSADGSAS